ncbi:WDR43 family protein [Megaselia abdita]
MKMEVDKHHKTSSSKVKTVSGGGLPLGAIQSKCFSQHGNLFALVNDQGILRIWDTETNELKQEYTPNLHLSGPCNTVLWVNFKSKRKSNTESTQGLHLVMGGNSGEVQLYSYTSGKVEGNLKGESHSAKINGLAFDGVKMLYSCGDDFQVIVWDLSLGKRVGAWSVGNEKPQVIAYLPEKKYLAVGGREILVFSTETQARLQKFTGHTSEVTILETFTYDDEEYILSASKMERVISLWKIKSGPVKSKSSDAICSFLMEDIASMITCNVNQSGETLVVSACTRSGVVHLYNHSLEDLKSLKPLKPKVTIQVASDGGSVIEPITVVAASMKFSENAKEVLFAYGDRFFLMFEKKQVDYSQKIDVLVRVHPKDALNEKKAKKGTQAKSLKTLIPTINPADVSYKSATAVQPQKTSKPVDTPMDERLQNLHLSNGEIPKSQSKVNLLVQALHSRDNSLLSTVLTTDDQEVIKLTLQKLPVQYVNPLVSELTMRMQKKSSHVETSMKWMKTLAQTHASQLMAQGHEDLMEKFGPCIAVIEHRISCMPELSKLNGRLQLLVNQITRNSNEDNLCNENVLVYEDNDDSSSSDLEGSKLDKSLSDDEWEEDEDEEESDMEVDA